MYTWKESFDVCKAGVCKYYSFDMDDAFCAHPKSLDISNGYGCSLNRMIKEGLCTGCYDDPKKNLRQLFERKE